MSPWRIRQTGRAASGPERALPRRVHSGGTVRTAWREEQPTPEQSAIISSPLTPRLVIAGAGSGKTATMADRVVWLVANGWVRPDEILGVTFTRKAAGELARRIRPSWPRWIAHGAVAGNSVFPAGLLSPMRSNPRSPPTTPMPVAGVRLRAAARHRTRRRAAGRGTVLAAGQPGCRSLRRRLRALPVRQVNARQGRDAIRRRVRGAPAGPGRGPRLAPERIAEFEALPYVAEAKKNPSQAAGELGAMLRTRPSVADLVGRYPEAEAAPAGALDFGDLVSLAARVAREVPQARRRSVSATRSSCWTNSRTRRTPRWCCSPAVRRRPRRDRGGGPQPVHLRIPGRLGRAAVPLCQRIPVPLGMARRDGAAADRHRRALPGPDVLPDHRLANGRNILATANLISAPLNCGGA